MYMEWKMGAKPMKDYERPSIETYGTVEALTEQTIDDGYGQN